MILIFTKVKIKFIYLSLCAAVPYAATPAPENANPDDATPVLEDDSPAPAGFGM